MFRPKRKTSDFSEEIEAHVLMEIDRLREQGLSEDAAQAAAYRTFGSPRRARETFYESQRWMWWDHLVQDIRFGLRTLRKSPGFTAVAVLTLALGIGANTAIFSIVDAVLLRPLPYPHASRLEQVVSSYPDGNVAVVSATKFLFWKEHNHTFSTLAAYNLQAGGLNLTGGGQPEYVARLQVSADFFRALGIKPALGREFTAEDERPGEPDVVILSNGLWKDRFGGDLSIIGKAISLGGKPYRVVGVMPTGFEFSPSAELWLPLHPVPNPEDRAGLFLALGRLKSGITVEQAGVDLTRVGEEFRRQYPNLMDETESVGVVNYQLSLTGDLRPVLLVLMGAVGLVLLIACANVANLLLARAIGRDREIAIRTAMGARRSRLVGQLLAESVILALAGGGPGLLISEAGLRGLLMLVPSGMPQMASLTGGIDRVAGVTLDARVLAFALLVSVLTGVIFGLAPAFQAFRVNVNRSLLEGGGRTTGSAWQGRLRGLLVVGEIAVSLILMTGASLLIRTFNNLLHVDPGFDAQNVLTMKLALTDPRYNSAATVAHFQQEVVRRVEAMPGVEQAAFVSNLPTERIQEVLPFQVAGREANAQGGGGAVWRIVTPQYFSAMKIALVQGRTFRESDDADSTGVVIIDQTLAKVFFPGQNPIGQHLTIGAGMGPIFSDEAREIVGVVSDTRGFDMGQPPRAVMFVPWSQLPSAISGFQIHLRPACLVVRTRVMPMSLSSGIAKQILDADSTQPVFQIQPLEAIVGDSVAKQQFDMTLLGIFAALALLLASAGIYGVISYSVAQRTHEFGIRTALGAQRGDVLKLVVVEGFKLALLGVGIGVAGTLGLTRFLSDLLYGVKPTDPATLIGVALLLLLVALVACYIPARRAMRVDPMVALRYE
jgi:putative ABC transport system permease protein